MRIYFLIFLGIILNLGFALAIADLELEIEDKGAVVISELNNAAVYDFIIENKRSQGVGEIYSLVGLTFDKKGTFEIPSGKSEIEVKAYISKEIRDREDDYLIEFFIKSGEDILTEKLPLKVVSLDNVFIINNVNLHPNDSTVNVTIKNRVNVNLENVNVSLNSVFFDYETGFDFQGFEEISFPVEIDRDKIERLIAGPYVLEAKIEINDETIKTEGIINYLEKEGTSISEASSGILIRELNIEKTNEGNIPVTTNIEMRKDVLSRLFTSYSVSPLSSERSGLVVDYLWEQDVNPGESFNVVSRTNYTFPFIAVVLVIIIVFLTRFYSANTGLTLKKTVSPVNTKGGEFALKVRLRIKAKKNVENIQVVDKLNGMIKLYGKYGRKPDKIDEKTRRMYWDIPRLNSGEERVISYIVYSKVRAVGRFELPSAMVSFVHEGKPASVYSNKTSFISDTAVED